MAVPAHYTWAQAEIGKREQPENRGPVVQRYIDLGKCGTIGDPWCAIFVNAALESNGVPGSKSPSSQSFRTDQNFRKLEKPFLGCIAVFWRGSGPNSGIGHVGFYVGERGDNVWVLGGNEGDMVQIEAFPKSAARFGLVGYYYPVSLQIPIDAAPVILARNFPSHIQTPKVT